MMPDLPNMGFERDLEQFRQYFSSPSFRTDGLKLYPTLVIRGTGLYELWKTGRYKNYTPDVLIDLLAQILALVPPWTRIYRIQRFVCFLLFIYLLFYFYIAVLFLYFPIINSCLIRFCVCVWCAGQRYSDAAGHLWRRARQHSRIGAAAYA
jgi:hypothetical protein